MTSERPVEKPRNNGHETYAAKMVYEKYPSIISKSPSQIQIMAERSLREVIGQLEAGIKKTPEQEEFLRVSSIRWPGEEDPRSLDENFRGSPEQEAEDLQWLANFYMARQRRAYDKPTRNLINSIKYGRELGQKKSNVAVAPWKDYPVPLTQQQSQRLKRWRNRPGRPLSSSSSERITQENQDQEIIDQRKLTQRFNELDAAVHLKLKALKDNKIQASRPAAPTKTQGLKPRKKILGSRSTPDVRTDLAGNNSYSTSTIKSQPQSLQDKMKHGIKINNVSTFPPFEQTVARQQKNGPHKNLRKHVSKRAVNKKSRVKFSFFGGRRKLLLQDQSPESISARKRERTVQWLTNNEQALKCKSSDENSIFETSSKTKRGTSFISRMSSIFGKMKNTILDALWKRRHKKVDPSVVGTQDGVRVERSANSRGIETVTEIDPIPKRQSIEIDPNITKVSTEVSGVSGVHASVSRKKKNRKYSKFKEQGLERNRNVSYSELRARRRSYEGHQQTSASYDPKIGSSHTEKISKLPEPFIRAKKEEESYLSKHRRKKEFERAQKSVPVELPDEDEAVEVDEDVYLEWLELQKTQKSENAANEHIHKTHREKISTLLEVRNRGKKENEGYLSKYKRKKHYDRHTRKPVPVPTATEVTAVVPEKANHEAIENQERVNLESLQLQNQQESGNPGPTTDHQVHVKAPVHLD